MSRLIVAVCSTTGPQSGKSTYLTDVLKKRRELSEALHLRFSDPLIAFLMIDLFALHGSNDYEAVKRMEIFPGVTGRDLMIAAGDTLRKTVHLSLYATNLMKRIDRIVGDNPIILDDLRKLPELDALVNSDHNVLVINVKKPLDPSQPRIGPSGDGEPLNDCEFYSSDLKGRLIGPRLRYMEVTWDGSGGFRTTWRNGHAVL